MKTLFLSTILDYFMNPFGGIFTLLWVIVLILVLRNIWRGQSRGDTAKILWSVLVFFFPIGGVIIWWLFGGKD
jgi:hypothetical protein